MNSLVHAWQSVSARLSANPWLRWGVPPRTPARPGTRCRAGQHGRLGGMQADYEDAVERLERTEALIDQRNWVEHLQAERESHIQIRSRFWEAETEGLAQAKLQAALSTLFQDLDLQDTRIRSGVNQEVPDLPGIRRVQTRLNAAYPPGIEPKMLHALAAHPRPLIVDRLELRRRGRSESRLTLSVSSYFVVGGGCRHPGAVAPGFRRKYVRSSTRRDDADSVVGIGPDNSRHIQSILRPGGGTPTATDRVHERRDFAPRQIHGRSTPTLRRTIRFAGQFAAS